MATKTDNRTAPKVAPINPAADTLPILGTIPAKKPGTSVHGLPNAIYTGRPESDFVIEGQGGKETRKASRILYDNGEPVTDGPFNSANSLIYTLRASHMEADARAIDAAVLAQMAISDKPLSVWKFLHNGQWYQVQVVAIVAEDAALIKEVQATGGNTSHA